MPVSAIRAISKSQNGVGAFIPQCKRLDFTFCDWAGSSKGMNAFITQRLPAFARQHPEIEINVFTKPRHHPVVSATYVNGGIKQLCVKNLTPKEVFEKATLLKDHDGKKLTRETRPVQSIHDSVRGIFSSIHSGPLGLGMEGVQKKIRGRRR